MTREQGIAFTLARDSIGSRWKSEERAEIALGSARKLDSSRRRNSQTLLPDAWGKIGRLPPIFVQSDAVQESPSIAGTRAT